MTLPGFTAEVSLPKTTTDYRVANAPLAGKCGPEVVPQFCIRQGSGFCCWIPYTGWVCRVLHTVM
jgi:hypothetical protein